MLTSATRYGYAKKGEVVGYSMAGKTGTSQIARGGRGYESGTGSTIGTYLGFGPASKPRFVILVKFDRPTYRYTAFGESTAGPVFHDIAAYILKYYGIAPETVPAKK